MRWLETDTNANVNLATGTSVGAYTADADRLMICDVFLDQLQGSGTYTAWVTQQINGAGSTYLVGPKTEISALVGETSLKYQSGFIVVRSGDILTVFVDGLSNDTTTPDTTVRWCEMAALRPTVAGRTVDVDASGGVEVGSFQAGAITAAAIATGAIDADALAADGVAEIVDAVWDEVIPAAHVTNNTAGKLLLKAQESTSVRDSTAQAGTASTITLDAGASAVDNFYNHNFVVITGGTGVGQVRSIQSYNGTTKVASIVPDWATTPNATSTFSLLAMGEVHAYEVHTGVPLSAAAIDDIFAEVVEGTVTFRQWVRRVAAVLFGKASGGGAAGSKKFRDLGDVLNRVDATTDANGNRTAVSFDDT